MKDRRKIVRIHTAAQLLAQGFADDIVVGSLPVDEQEAAREMAAEREFELRELHPRTTDVEAQTIYTGEPE